MLLLLPDAQVMLHTPFGSAHRGSGPQKPQDAELGSVSQTVCDGHGAPQEVSQMTVPQVAELGSASQMDPARGVTPPHVVSQMQMSALGLQTKPAGHWPQG